MLKSKLNEEEKKERKRLMERIRKAKIKSDPVLREQHLRKDRERLAKRKAAGLILTRSQMTAHARRNAQKKNRISARAYYQRKKNKANGARNNPTSVSETNDAESLPKNQDNEPGISQELIGPHSPRLLRQNVRCNSPNLRIDAIVASSSHYLRTSSQYRNKKIFYIMSQLSIYCSSLTNIIWNYSECGHGKGAPDGVGGLLKRTADRFVAHDGDMNNIDSFVNYLKSAVQGVKISTVEEYEVKEKDWLLPTNLNTFRGTLQVKQVIWTKEAKNRIVLRRLSCIEDKCMKYVVKCPHGKHLDFHNLSTEHEIKSKPQLSTSSNKKSKTKSKIDITKMRPVKLTDKLILFPQPSHSKYFTPSNTLKISENAAPRSSSSTKMSENLLLNYVDLDQSTPACSFLEKIDTNILVGLEESTQFVNKEDTVKASNRFSSPTVEDSDTDEEIFRIKSKINFKKEKNEPRKPTPDIKQRFNYIFGCSDTDDDLF
ncbi:hypothetical protein HW555_011295 [Spodoptera exigua]|uniref:Uncharacterized protein n=1 Tax=Spodoptera exigua TaxID=7107 RepID=A0A835G9B2_SPOEX|nr:hypothetical protein HW555_011295 [Spodoptera exigua]